MSNFNFLWYPCNVKIKINSSYEFLFAATFVFTQRKFRVDKVENSHVDVSRPPSKWLKYGHRLLIFLISAAIWLSEKSLISDFRVFSWERKGEMV